MITIKDVWSKTAFDDLKLKDYIDITDDPKTHECENVEENFYV